MIDAHTRRTFLRTAIAAGAVWATADLVEVEEALAWASHQATNKTSAAFVALTPDQAKALESLTARILPSAEGRPGAREAGVVYFIDKALATFNSAQKAQYVEGVQDLNARAGRKWPGAAGFAALTAAQQDELLHEIETTPFFEAALFDTIVGAFALPTWGGNRDYAGWHALGFEHQPVFQPPFGHYDADANRKR